MNKEQHLMIDDILRYSKKTIDEESWNMTAKEFGIFTATLLNSMNYLLTDMRKEVEESYGMITEV